MPATGQASRKGWIAVGFDQAVWIPCLPVFPDGEDRRSWAQIYARHWWDASGLQHGERDVAALRDSLAALHEIIYETLPCQMALIHLPGPRAIPLPVCFGIWPADGDRTAHLRLLAHADEQDVIVPPIVEDCSSQKLGGGLKALCYLPGPDDSVSACLNYAWRSEDLQTAVRMFTSCRDLGRLQQAMPDLDKLTQVISFIPRPPAAGDQPL